MKLPAGHGGVAVGGILWLAVAACSEDDGTDAGFDTGLPEDMMVQDLNGAEVRQFCRGTADAFLEAGFEDVCIYEVLAGYFLVEGNLATTAGECRESVPYCVAFHEQLLSDVSECVDGFEDLRSCEVTVGEWEICYGWALDSQSFVYSGLTCEDIDEPSALEEVEQRIDDLHEQRPPACDGLTGACDAYLLFL